MIIISILHLCDEMCGLWWHCSILDTYLNSQDKERVFIYFVVIVIDPSC